MRQSQRRSRQLAGRAGAVPSRKRIEGHFSAAFFAFFTVFFLQLVEAEVRLQASLDAAEEGRLAVQQLIQITRLLKESEATVVQLEAKCVLIVTVSPDYWLCLLPDFICCLGLHFILKLQLTV